MNNNDLMKLRKVYGPAYTDENIEEFEEKIEKHKRTMKKIFTISTIISILLSIIAIVLFAFQYPEVSDNELTTVFYIIFGIVLGSVIIGVLSLVFYAWIIYFAYPFIYRECKKLEKEKDGKIIIGIIITVVILNVVVSPILNIVFTINDVNSTTNEVEVSQLFKDKYEEIINTSMLNSKKPVIEIDKNEYGFYFERPYMYNGDMFIKYIVFTKNKAYTWYELKEEYYNLNADEINSELDVYSYDEAKKYYKINKFETIKLKYKEFQIIERNEDVDSLEENVNIFYISDDGKIIYSDKNRTNEYLKILE